MNTSQSAALEEGRGHVGAVRSITLKRGLQSSNPAEPAAGTPVIRHTLQAGIQPAERNDSLNAVPVLGTPGTVLILGARGRLGYACVQAFAQAGWRVLAHVRQGSGLVQHPWQGDLAPGAVRWIDASMSAPHGEAVWEEVAASIDVVVNALAPQFSTRAWQNELPTLNLMGISVARYCQAQLIAPLSILSFANQLPEVLFEDAPLPALHQIATRMGRLRAQTELELRVAAEAGVKVCTLRAGAFFGHPGDGWLSGAIAKRLPSGQMSWLGPYDVATPWVYVSDLAQCIERIACQRQRLGDWTRLHFAGHQVTGAQWRDALMQEALCRGWLQPGHSIKANRLRWSVWKPVGWFSHKIRALCEMEYVWRTPHRLDNQCLEALIGAEPRTDWQQSVAQTLDLLFPQEAKAQ